MALGRSGAMPIQNVGTLLENLVVTEASLALLNHCRHAPFEFLNSFAMPPRTPWVPHAQNGGFEPATLDRLRSLEDSPLFHDIAYPGLLRANLHADGDQGPNAALLIAGAILQNQVPCRMWLNDVRNGHYGDAIPELQRLESTARTIYGLPNDRHSAFTVRVSDVAYPTSVADLASGLSVWMPAAGARLGFLDPMRYRVRHPQAAQTSSEDHRRWLEQIAFNGPTCAVQFTGNRDSSELERELCSLHGDALAEGYNACRFFKRQHYVVFVATRSPSPEMPEQVAADIENRVRRAWISWGRTVACCKLWDLRISRDGTVWEHVASAQ